MLIAYLDEIGEPGAFVSKDHSRFNTSPAFGYAGFILPESAVRTFGAQFARNKAALIGGRSADNSGSGQSEVKGSDLFQKSSLHSHPQHLRIFRALCNQVKNLGGALFYYADEKPIGTAKQVGLDIEAVESQAMQESINRLCRHADKVHNANLMILIDQINEKQRAARLSRMYGHIFARSTRYSEMKRILEPPMHVDSLLSSGIQFADWIASYTSKAIEFQLLGTVEYRSLGQSLVPWERKLFTHESKLHFNKRALDDICHSQLFQGERPLESTTAKWLDPDQARILDKVHAVRSTRKSK